jgi:2-hydroxychromene-2-carboxylate isomerase
MTFYFDFVSPNRYIAANRIGDLAAKHARAVDWRPVSLFQVWDAIDHTSGGPDRAGTLGRNAKGEHA